MSVSSHSINSEVQRIIMIIICFHTQSLRKRVLFCKDINFEFQSRIGEVKLMACQKSEPGLSSASGTSATELRITRKIARSHTFFIYLNKTSLQDVPEALNYSSSRDGHGVLLNIANNDTSLNLTEHHNLFLKGVPTKALLSVKNIPDKLVKNITMIDVSEQGFLTRPRRGSLQTTNIASQSFDEDSNFKTENRWVERFNLPEACTLNFPRCGVLFHVTDQLATYHPPFCATQLDQLDCAMNRETPYISSVKNARAPYSISIYDYCTGQRQHGSSLPQRENVELIAIKDGRQPWTRLCPFLLVLLFTVALNYELGESAEERGKAKVSGEKKSEDEGSDEEPQMVTREKLRKGAKTTATEKWDKFLNVLDRRAEGAGIGTREAKELIGMYREILEESANKEGQIEQLEKENGRLRKRIEELEKRESKEGRLEERRMKEPTYADIVASIAPRREKEEDRGYGGPRKCKMFISSVTGKKVEEVERYVKAKIDHKQEGVRIISMRKTVERLMMEAGDEEELRKIKRLKELKKELKFENMR
uniref:Uncharacterized protein n=1 Tax=Timema tahoe TaxID=61484 RepID=A0A7R9IF19_9NEOP|nr:unnamed protein product [Timema tahoe]